MARTGEGYAFSALADPTRRAILTLLSERQVSAAGEIANNFPEMTRAAVSSHLQILRQAGLIEERHQGKYRLYSLGPNRADEVVAFLSDVYARALGDLGKAAQERS